MNIVFISIGATSGSEGNSIYTDLLKCFYDHGHRVTAICQRERRYHLPTLVEEEDGIKVLRVKTGNITKTNLIEKGISTLLISNQYNRAIRKYLKEMNYDLILYTTPPITIDSTVYFLKKRYHAVSYLMLKDMFPQNAVDLGILKQSGIKGLITRYFTAKERRLYRLSDCIGCMSGANAQYLLEHNPYLVNHRIEVCPNTITPAPFVKQDKNLLREQLGLPKDRMLFICGGNFGFPQSVDFILKVLAGMTDRTDVFMIFCGSGTEYHKLKEYSRKENREQLLVMDHLRPETFARLLDACDVGLLFLDHRFTIPNFPSRMLEYMNHELAVFAATDKSTDIGRVIETGDFGWWCESKDVREYLYLLEDICKHPEAVAEKGRNSREILEQQYSTSIAYEKIIRSYTAVREYTEKM